MKKNKLSVITFLTSLLLGLAAILIISPSKGDVPREALVAPGEHDEYYGFLSGGPGGDIRVMGIPSMRLIRKIPVFEPSFRYNYGVGEDGQVLAEFGNYTWGDTHHPALSQTNGENDGRWLFINDKGNGRIAKIDLKKFAVEKILKVPTARAIHGLVVDPVSSRYLAGAIEYPIYLGDGFNDEPDEEMAGIMIMDPETLDIKYQIAAPKKDRAFG